MRLRKFFGNMLALGIGVILALGLAELTLRIYNPFTTPVRGGNVRLEKNTILKLKNVAKYPGIDDEITIRKNSLGFRGEEPPDFINRYISIIAIGGSTTECMYIGEGLTWPEKLQNKLRARKMNVWVNNAGIGGHSTVGHTMILKQVVAPMHPNIVLFLIGINDIGTNGLAIFTEMETAVYLMNPTEEEKSLSNRLIRHSELMFAIDTVRRTFKARDQGLMHSRNVLIGNGLVTIQTAPPIESKTEQQRQAILASYEQSRIEFGKRVSNLISFSKDAGILPVMITQPAFYSCFADPSTGFETARHLMNRYDGCTEWQLLETYNDVTRKTAATAGVPLIDLARKIPHDSKYFYDNMHFNKTGTEAVAAVIEPELAAIIGDTYGRIR